MVSVKLYNMEVIGEFADDTHPGYSVGEMLLDFNKNRDFILCAEGYRPMLLKLDRSLHSFDSMGFPLSLSFVPYDSFCSRLRNETELTLKTKPITESIDVSGTPTKSTSHLDAEYFVDETMKPPIMEMLEHHEKDVAIFSTGIGSLAILLRYQYPFPRALLEDHSIEQRISEELLKKVLHIKERRLLTQYLQYMIKSKND